VTPAADSHSHDRDDEYSALAHELKTPLAVIIGFAELLAARDDERTREEATKRILEASSRLSDALDDFLEIIFENEQLARGLMEAKRARGTAK
jgi:signal transduction histidine kinase